MYNIKKVCLLVGCLLSIICLSACDKTYSDFNPEVERILSEQYGIILPNSALFVSGKYNSVAKDPMLTVVFDVPSEEYINIYKEGWWDEEDVRSSVENVIGVETKVSDAFDGKWINEYSYSASCSVIKIENEFFRVEFIGLGVITTDYDI